MAIKLHSSFAVHPGVWLRAGDRRAGRFERDRARRSLGCRSAVDEQAFNGRQGLSADMAIRFEKAFGLKAETLMRMQAAHELAEARAHEDEIEVEAVAA